MYDQYNCCIFNNSSYAVVNYALKFPNFGCHGNKGPSEIYCNDTVKLPDLQKPRLVQESRLYLFCKPSYSYFCANIRCHGTNIITILQQRIVTFCTDFMLESMSLPSTQSRVKN